MERKKEMKVEESEMNVGLGIKILTAMKQSFKASKVWCWIHWSEPLLSIHDSLTRRVKHVFSRVSIENGYIFDDDENKKS